MNVITFINRLFSRFKNQEMQLKPQDLLLSLLLAAEGVPQPNLAMAEATGLSRTETHMSLRRAEAAGLVITMRADDHLPLGRAPKVARVHVAALVEFVTHGVRYVFVPDRGAIARGMATGSAAPVLSYLGLQAPAIPSVWPDPRGGVRGEAFSPLYPSAVAAAERSSRLYELLALVDLIRGGSAREQELAKEAFRLVVTSPAKEPGP